MKDASSPAAPGAFLETRWSLVLNAGSADPAQATAALAELYQRYRYPLYAYVRRTGQSHADAEDLLQGFFAKLIEKRWLATADPALGRFRSFLIVTLRHYLSNDWRRGQTLRRGGGQQLVSISDPEAEERYAGEAANHLTPDALFDRRWALTVLDRAMLTLRQRQAAAGEAARFAILEPAVPGERTEQGYAALGEKLGLSVNGVKTAVRRLRQQFGEILRAEIGDTVAGRSDIDGEMRHLMAILQETS
jgi:RNA polymerase sigma factor (sigma-70 family)